MLINGKDRKFRYTVGASVKIAEVLCPDQNIMYLNSVIMEKNYRKAVANFYLMAIIMNEQYELSLHRSDPKHKMLPNLTVDDLADLNIEDFDKLETEVLDAIEKGSRQLVETKPSESKKKVQKSH